jgi:sugar phosphate isomerase/epimerase
MTHRRQFLAQAGLAASLPKLVSAAEAERFTIGLSQYSLRAMLKDGSLAAEDFPAFTADSFGIKAIDFWEGGIPKDKLDDAAYLAGLRKRADDAGTDLFLLMTGALDASPKKRKASLAKILPSVGRADTLGARFLRVFLKAPGGDEAAVLPLCVEALKPLCDAAAKKNIVVAIEPGASKLSARGAFLAKVFTALNHEACCLMPDFGKQKGNVYDGTEAMLPYTKTISCKMHSFDDAGNQPDFDYARLMKMIAGSDYRGILAIEWEGHILQPVPGVKAAQALIAKSLA